MPQWLLDNSAGIQVIIGAVTALIWLTYLQILVSGVIRSRRPKILITRGAGYGLHAQILVSNLGYEPVYIRDVVLSVKTDNGVFTSRVTDRTEVPDSEVARATERTTQGPLNPGELFNIGSANDLLSRMEQAIDLGDVAHIKYVELMIIGSAARLFAAKRDYDIVEDDEGRLRLKPLNYGTETIISQSRCKRILDRLGPDL